MKSLVGRLKEGHHSLVVENNGRVFTFDSRGVKDLFELVTNRPEILDGARVADKVVGKGAAALMILGKVRELHAVTISEPTLELLNKYGVKVTFENRVEHIINRTGTGICPVEQLCADCATPEQALPLIREFLNSLNSKV